MQGEKFTLMQYNISAILGFIEAGDFVIPEIQRPFVWKRAQVRDLIDSLYNGYPTGYIITWKNPDVHTKDGAVANGKRVLIDGQQRITALMAAVSGLEVLDEDFNKDRIKIAFNPLAKDSDKIFAVQDASHLKDKKWIPDIAEVFKVFGDTTRMKIISALLEAELCVGDIAEITNSTQSAISHQLRVLKQAKLVKFRKEGKIVYYSLDDEHVSEMYEMAKRHIEEEYERK